MRTMTLFDQNWKFHAGDFDHIRNRWAFAKSGSWNQGPESVGFDDSSWRTVCLPHDYVIEGQPVPCQTDELSDGDNAIPEMHTIRNMHTASGSFPKQIGWYRKHFSIPAAKEGQKYYLIFDGVYRDSMIFLNNFFVKSHRSGYTGICCDITDFINYGGENVLSVCTDARQPEGWFYEGGGIYRHVWLLKACPSHIDTVFIDSRPDISSGAAQLTIQTELVNPQQADTLTVELISPDGSSAAILTNAVIGSVNTLHTELSSVRLWDIRHPQLYTALCRLYRQGELIDELSASFGIRSIRFDASRGFLLNEHPVKLRGVCCHQNHGGLGTALPDAMYAYRIQKLKEMGANALRCSHYPPSPALLDACDRLGMLVMDETRLLSSAEEDLMQLEFMVKRDRNHPSVILYSIGNEEAQSQATAQGARIAETMIGLIRLLDSTRPVTMGLLMWDLANKRPIEDISNIAGISEKLDVAGFNYHEHRWEEYHRRYPNQPMICTEQGTFKSTRGCYQTDAEACHLAVTDSSANSYMKGAAQWHAARPDYISGLFLWTGFDYYGEPTPYAWPAILSQFGAMDICGYPKDFYYYYRAWWTDEPVLHLFPHWNGAVGEQKDIHVFSNCDEVELYVNERSFGKKKMETDGYLTWPGIRYEPGCLLARGWKNGQLIIEETVKTTGSPAQAVLKLDFLEQDIAVIRAEVQDREGQTVPEACTALHFLPEGDAVFLGASNGNPSDHTLAHSHQRSAFHGLAQCILKVGSHAALSVQADGIEGSRLEIR